MRRSITMGCALLAALALGVPAASAGGSTKAPQLRTDDRPRKPDQPRVKRDAPPATQEDSEGEEGKKDGDGQVGRKVETKPEQEKGDGKK